MSKCGTKKASENKNTQHHQKKRKEKKKEAAVEEHTYNRKVVPFRTYINDKQTRNTHNNTHMKTITLKTLKNKKQKATGALGRREAPEKNKQGGPTNKKNVACHEMGPGASSSAPGKTQRMRV